MRMRRSGLIIALVLASSGVARAQRTGVGSSQADTDRCLRLYEDGEYAKAERACMAALRRDASYTDAWKLYLSTLIAERKEEKAIDEATRAEETLGIRDASVFALHGAAILQAANRPEVDPQTHQPNKWAKQLSRALPFFERAVALNREGSVGLLVSLAWTHYNHKRYAEAQTIAEQVLRLRPTAENHFKAEVVIGLSRVGLGDCDGARRILEPLQKLPGDHSPVDRGLAQCAPPSPRNRAE